MSVAFALEEEEREARVFAALGGVLSLTGLILWICDAAMVGRKTLNAANEVATHTRPRPVQLAGIWLTPLEGGLDVGLQLRF